MHTLADVVRKQAAGRPDHTALTYVNDGRSWTYAQLDAESNRVAQALLAAGVGPGDRIAYLDKNSPEYFSLLFGGAKVNAASVAVNWRLAVPEMEYILDNSEATILLVGDEFLNALGRMNLSRLATVVVIGDPGKSGYPTYDQWLAGQPAHDPGVPVDDTDTCYQLYTSGTTGLPKGVEITHANFLHAMEVSLGALEIDADTVNLVCMPLFHISGSGWGVAGLYHGARSLLLRDVDLPLIARLIGEERITHSLFVPAVLQFLLAVPGVGNADFSSMRAIAYGASPITESVLVQAMETFGCKFYQAYGLTETTGCIVLLHHDDHDPGGPRAHLLRSCGKVIDNCELKIVDTTRREAQFEEAVEQSVREDAHPARAGAGNGPRTEPADQSHLPDSDPIAAAGYSESPEGEVGEIWIKGPQNMKGYWHNPEANREVFVGEWFRTGDAGYLRDGYLYIHDRIKDMIISGGENIYPAEIENVLMKHDHIADAAVIGVPDERWGETVKAIVKRTDDSLTEEDVMGFCRKNLAHYKCPTSVDWTNDLPRNPSGKILKVELRKPYWKGRSRQVS